MLLPTDTVAHGGEAYRRRPQRRRKRRAVSAEARPGDPEVDGVDLPERVAQRPGDPLGAVDERHARLCERGERVDGVGAGEQLVAGVGGAGRDGVERLLGLRLVEVVRGRLDQPE